MPAETPCETEEILAAMNTQKTGSHSRIQLLLTFGAFFSREENVLQLLGAVQYQYSISTPSRHPLFYRTLHRFNLTSMSSLWHIVQYIFQQNQNQS